MVKVVISERCDSELKSKLEKIGIKIDGPFWAKSYEEEKELGKIAETIYRKDAGLEYGIACYCYCSEEDKETVINTCASLINKPLTEEEKEIFSDRSRKEEWSNINAEPLDADFVEIDGEVFVDFHAPA